MRMLVRRLEYLWHTFALAIVVAASLMAVAAIPEWAITPSHEGTWRGVMAHKNILERAVGF